MIGTDGCDEASDVVYWVIPALSKMLRDARRADDWPELREDEAGTFVEFVFQERWQ
jgi:hypothetical protein